MTNKGLRAMKVSKGRIVRRVFYRAKMRIKPGEASGKYTKKL